MEILEIIEDIVHLIAFLLYRFVYASWMHHGNWKYHPVEGNFTCISYPKKQMPISIQMCLYNKKKYLNACFRSLINDPFFKNCEINIVDDHSTDGSLEIVQDYASKYNNVKIYQNEKNKGTLATRIICIKKATGKYIYTLDPDDENIPGALEFLYNISEVYQSDVLNYQKFKTLYYKKRMPYEKFDSAKNLVNNWNHSDIFSKFRNDTIQYTLNENFIRTDIYKKAVALIPDEVANKFICTGEDLLIFGLVMKYTNKWVKISNYAYIYCVGMRDSHAKVFSKKQNKAVHHEMCDVLQALLNTTIAKSYYDK